MSRYCEAMILIFRENTSGPHNQMRGLRPFISLCLIKERKIKPAQIIHQRNSLKKQKLHIYTFCSASHRSASSAAAQPVPAAVTACLYL